MKTTATRLFLIAIVAMMTISMSAQDNTKQRKTREELAQMQAQRISDQLAFDDKTTARFIEIYCQCQREVWALGPRMKGRNGQDTESQGNDGSGQTVKQRLDRSQKLLDIRKKYYAEYAKFLTEKQIERVYQIEKQMMSRLAKRGRTHTERGK